MKKDHNHSRATKPTTNSILLRDPAAINVIVQRSKREMRSMSAALACVVLEWAAFKSAVRKSHAAARRTESLQERSQDTSAGSGIQQEKPTAAGSVQEAAGQEKEIHNEG